MSDEGAIIVYGVGELASAVARLLLLSGRAVAMHAPAPPRVLRRGMAFADVWQDGVALLDGVEARRAQGDAALLAGLRGRMFIPVLPHPARETVLRWPWDVAIDARGPSPGLDRDISGDAELTISLGPGAVAGRDCDLVIETGGRDPGAVLRSGAAAGAPAPDPFGHPVAAPAAGPFHTEMRIGDEAAAGGLVGLAGVSPVLAPRAGRLRGLLRSGTDVARGEVVAEIVDARGAPVFGVRPADQAIARAVALAIEVEQHGGRIARWPPAPS